MLGLFEAFFPCNYMITWFSSSSFHIFYATSLYVHISHVSKSHEEPVRNVAVSKEGAFRTSGLSTDPSVK